MTQDQINLIELYEETLTVDPLSILLESSLSRIWRRTSKHTCGIITAFRGSRSYEENQANNQRLMVALRKKGYSVTKVQGTYLEDDPKKKKEEPPEPEGPPKKELSRYAKFERGIKDPPKPDPDARPEGGIPVNELSFFVANIQVDGDDRGQLEKDLGELGYAFEQDSVLIIPPGGKCAYLLGTSPSDAWPGLGKRYFSGDAKFRQATKRFFSKVGGREFAFESVELPNTNAARRGWCVLQKEAEEIVEAGRRHRRGW